VKIIPKVLFFGGVAVFAISQAYESISYPPGVGGGPMPTRIPLVPVLAGTTMQIVISLALLAATLFVILSKSYPAKDKHWAYSTLGMVVGFWLKT
jgi:hypothetical protein